MTYYHHRKPVPTPPSAVFWRTVALIFMGMSLSMLAAMWSMSNRVEPAALVYQVCNESRMSATISERGCADLQDQLHLEFLCTQANDRPDNHCWVEVKE
jgi:hypothetical protein